MIGQRIAQIQEQIASIASRVHRDPSTIQLIAVSKTHSPEMVQQAIESRVHHFGENRIQEAAQKIPALVSQYPPITWHLIGHLQRNKAKTAVELFDMVHSVDSLRLAETLNRQCEQLARPPLPVLLQVNVSGETSKDGFDVPGGMEHSALLSAFLEEVSHIIALPALQVQGLMTIAPFTANPQDARHTFRTLRLLRDRLAHEFPDANWQHLSMGMTHDFEVAIEEGATFVRIGRAIFGERGA